MEYYNIYLANPYRLEYSWQELVEEVFELFQPVVQASSRFDQLRVRSIRTRPSLASHELMCYVLPSRGASLIRSADFGTAAESLGDDGTTAWKNGGEYVSEAYRHGWEPSMLARIIYHELMHNKLKEGNRMHRRGGMAAAEIGEDSEQRRENIQRLANRLHLRHPQWMGGFELVSQRENALDALLSDDPLAGI